MGIFTLAVGFGQIGFPRRRDLALDEDGLRFRLNA